MEGAHTNIRIDLQDPGSNIPDNVLVEVVLSNKHSVNYILSVTLDGCQRVSLKQKNKLSSYGYC